MSRNQKENNNTPIIVLCVIMAILVLCFGGVILYLLFQSRQTPTTKLSTQEAESGTEVSETEDFTENGELYCEGVEEAHVAFDEETGLQYADNQLLITAASGVSKEDVEALIAPYKADIVGMIEVTGIYQIKFPESYSKEELDEIGGELSDADEIESYETNIVFQCEEDISAFEPGKNPEWENDWGDITPNGKNWGMEAIHAQEAWGYYKEMGNVNVGIFDNMFYDHKDLTFQGTFKNVTGDQLNDSHGTHVSGVVGADYNNDIGICGVCPGAKLYGASYALYNSVAEMKAAFTYFIHINKCRVINMSFGNPEQSFAASRNNEAAIKAIEKQAQVIGDYLQELLDLSEENDFVISKSAGNDNDEYQFVRADEDDKNAPYGYILYTQKNRSRYKKYEKEKDFAKRIVTAKKTGCVEANNYMSAISKKNIKDRILVVGAAQNLGNGQYQVADFSDCGKRVDVVAPGVDIYSTVEEDKYEYKGWSGTSMAAPHVAGVAALCFSVNEDLDGAQVKEIVRSTAEGKIQYAADNTNGSRQFSYPMVNAEKAVEKALKMKKEKDNEKDTNKKQDNVTRDIVLVLDRSGSMGGEPLNQTKQAALKFVETVFEQQSRVSVVSYDSSAAVDCGLTDNQDELRASIDNLYAGNSTNMYDGLEQADNILQNSQADRRIIVLMSDGLPNEGVSDNGDYSAALLRYAQEMKDKGYYIYTLGFFIDVSGGELYSAQQLMEGIASPGLHYEVNSADDLVFFFGDIADQISGTRYVYIRIACPVDVKVTSNGETLSSKADSENTRTSFGALTYESIQEESEDETDYNSIYDTYYEDTENLRGDRVKVLRLNMDENYDVEIEGYDKGKMNYTVSFPNKNGEYDDVREFPGIAVTSSMKATSNTSEKGATYLKVDENGDGKVDTTYRTEANGKMEEVKDPTVLYIVLIAAAAVMLLVLVLIIVLVHASGKKKRSSQGNGQTVGYVYGVFGIFKGQSYAMRLGQRCVVGRKSACDIQLVHGQVSRIHCVIQMLPDGVYQVTDYSSNGTFYNNQRLKSRQPYRLPKGALLAIGDADNVLELK